VVFRPATKRRALLAGEEVTLQSACRSCGETLRIAWSLDTDNWSATGTTRATAEPTLPATRTISPDHAAEVREIEAQLADLSARRAARAAAKRDVVELDVDLPLAAGGETQWFDPAQYPALAHAHRSAIETFEAIEAEVRAEDDAAEERNSALDWRAGSYADMLAVENDVELAAGLPDVDEVLDAAVSAPTRIARGFGATPKRASTAANAEIDAFLGKFADRVARARKKLEHVQTNLPATVAESQLRSPDLRRTNDEQVTAASDENVVDAAAIALPTFAEPVATIEPQRDAVIQPEIAQPEAELEPEPELEQPTADGAVPAEVEDAPEAAPALEAAPAPEPAPVVARDPELANVPEVPQPAAREIVHTAPEDLQQPAPIAQHAVPNEPVAPVASQPAPAAAESAALPRVELAPPAPLPVEEYPTPLHERAQLLSTDSEVFGARPVAAPELVSDVWGDAPSLDAHSEPASGLQPVADAPAFAYDADEATDSFAALTTNHETTTADGFDWSDDDEPQELAPKQVAHQKAAKENKARAKARAKARKARARREKPARRKPAATASRSTTRTMSFGALKGGSTAVATASQARVRVRMGLPEVAIVVILAAVAGIAFMKLINTPPELDATKPHPGATSAQTAADSTTSAAKDGDLVAGGGAPTNAALADDAATSEPASSTPDSTTTQDPADAADTAVTAASSGSSPQSNPSADA
jgi:hypothetical protein